MPNQRGFAQVILILLLLAGLGAGLYLSGQTQIFKPKAAPTLPSSPEASLELELEKNGETPFLDEATPTTITPGSKFRVDIYARSDIDAANLFQAKIKYSTDTVELVEINKRDGQSFVGNWVETSSGNGVVSIVGGKANPGIKTDSTSGALLMGSIIFKAKATGTANIELINTSAIYRNSDNTNIISARKGAISVPIQEITASPTPTPAAISCTNVIVEGAIQGKLAGQTIYTVESGGKIKITADITPADTKLEWKEVSRSRNLPAAGKFEYPDANNTSVVNYTAPANPTQNPEGTEVRADVPGDPSQNPPASCPAITIAVKPAVQPTPTPTYTVTPTSAPVKGDGDGNKDGKVDLIDLSVLLTDFNKDGGFRTGVDLNGDGVVNTFDFSLMRNLLIANGIIKDTGDTQPSPTPTPTSSPTPSATPTPSPTPASGGAFSFTLSNSQTILTCSKTDTNCKYTSSLIARNKLDKPVFNTTVYKSDPSNVIEGYNRSVVSSGAIYTGQTALNSIVNVKAPSTLNTGLHYATLYLDGQVCNMNTNPPNSCTFYGASSLDFKVTVSATNIRYEITNKSP